MPRKALILAAVAVGVLVLAAVLYVFWPRGAERAVLGDPTMDRLVSGAPRGLKVSTVVPNGSRVPVEYTCDGTNRPLPLRVEGVPEGTRSLLVIMYDPDAPGGTFIHWLLTVVDPPSTLEIPETTAEIVVGTNSFGWTGYGGPCPPPGDKPHRYYILVVALDRHPGNYTPYPRGYSLGEALGFAEDHVISWGYLVLYYSR